MKAKLFLSALSLAAVVGPLVHSGVANAAPTPTTDTDKLAIATSQGSIDASLRWTKVSYNHQARDNGEFAIARIRLNRNVCASVAIDWYDGENPDPIFADGQMDKDLGCVSRSTNMNVFDMSRFNVPPAERAVICLTTTAFGGLGVSQTTCVTSLPFTDDPSTGI